MRYLALLILIGFTGLTLTYHDAAYGAYMPLPPLKLLESSEVILVGNITSVNVTEIVETMGTKNPQNYTTTIDEYKVKVEEYLKNPLKLDEVTAVSESGSDSFEVGDRVLLYVKEQNDILTYYHESFVLPTYCDARKVMEEPKRVDPFIRMQNGTQKDQEFTADIPIQFRYQKDMRTLEGKGFDVQVAIVKETENNDEIIYDKIIHTESKPCEWIASAEWDITPDEGKYRMSVGTKEEGDTMFSMYTGPFYVTSDKVTNSSPPQFNREMYKIHEKSPLKQFESGIPIDEIQCGEGLVLITKSSDGLPACVTLETKQKLVERGWAKIIQVNINRQLPTVYIGPTDIPSANNQFAIKFYSRVSQENTNNVFFSPASIFTAFAIAYEGAQGNTATEMEQVFGFEPDYSVRHERFASMQQRLNFEGQNNTLSIANALWLAKNFEPYDDYVSNVENHYSGKVESVDFASKEKSLDIINQWVHDNTGGKIEKIFETLDPDTKLAITNAIYFKGIWEEPFEKDRTTMAPFHVGDGVIVSVPMMELKTTYLNQTKTPTARILELPYQGSKISMLILLPNEIDGIRALEDSLSAENIGAWQEDYTKIKTKAYIPKFKLETEYDLIPPLVGLGVRDAFGSADFSGISELDLFIYKARHKALVEVNEEGTEAAAATGMAMLESGPVEFRADHPFVFVIQDNETSQILFMGRVTDPTK